MSWSHAVSLVVEAIAVPYGYTVAIWSAGMLATIRYGFPRTLGIILFVLGATGGYLLFDLPVFNTIYESPNFVVRLPSTALLNMLPVIPALLAALIVRRIPWRPLGFLAVGFSTTALYILALSLLFWLAAR